MAGLRRSSGGLLGRDDEELEFVLDLLDPLGRDPEGLFPALPSAFSARGRFDREKRCVRLGRADLVVPNRAPELKERALGCSREEKLGFRVDRRTEANLLLPVVDVDRTDTVAGLVVGFDPFDERFLHAHLRTKNSRISPKNQVC